MTLRNAFDALATETTLGEVRDRLAGTLGVALDAATLAALEQITVTVANPETGGATETTLAAVLAALGAPLAVTGSVEVANDVGNPLPVSGTVAVSNFPASVEVANDAGAPLPVAGTVAVSNLPAVQTVVGAVEVANDSGAPLPISGTVTVANPTANPEVGLAKDATVTASLLAVADRLDLLTQILYDNPSDQDRPFARDNADQLRVLMSGGGADVTALRWGNNNAAPTSYYVTGGPNSMDARELAMQQSDIAFDAERRAWVIT